MRQPCASKPMPTGKPGSSQSLVTTEGGTPVTSYLPLTRGVPFLASFMPPHLDYQLVSNWSVRHCRPAKKKILRLVHRCRLFLPDLEETRLLCCGRSEQTINMATIGSLVFCTVCGNLLPASKGSVKNILHCECCGAENQGVY